MSAALITFLIFFAMAGWGAIGRKLSRMPALDPGSLSAFGMALLCVIGGALNQVGIANRAVCLAVIATGIVAFLAHSFFGQPRRLENPGSSVWSLKTLSFAALCGTILMILLLGAAGQGLNGNDDAQAYAVFPLKMIQTGSLGTDAFNERRMLSFGGQSFLDALFLSMGRIENLNSLDLGLGRLVFLTLAMGHIFRRTRSIEWCLFGAILSLLIPASSVNISSTMTGLALFYALFLELGSASPASWQKKTIAVAVLFAGLCSLKHLYVGIGLFILIATTLVSIRDRSVSLKSLGLCLFLTILFLSPWMIDCYRSNGTLLYPLLGAGYHGSVYGISPGLSASFEELKNLRYTASTILELIVSPEFLSSAVIVFLVLRNPDRRRLRSAYFVVLISAWFLALLFAPMSGGFRRYIFPFTCAALFYAWIERMPANPKQALQSYAIAALLLPSFWNPGIHEIDSSVLRILHPQSFFSHKDMDRARTIQAQVPQGEKILAVMSQPFLLDFSRNEIAVVDHAGGSSPPPGLPLRSSPESIARYLAEQNIRYVLYSYADEGGYGRRVYASRLLFSGNFYANRVRRLAENNFLFRDKITALASQYKVIADDGFQYVIDLGSPAR